MITGALSPTMMGSDAAVSGKPPQPPQPQPPTNSGFPPKRLKPKRLKLKRLKLKRLAPKRLNRFGPKRLKPNRPASKRRLKPPGAKWEKWPPPKAARPTDPPMRAYEGERPREKTSVARA